MTGPSGKIQEFRKEQLLISTDPSRLDVNAIHAFLTRSWWAEGISKETVARALANSLCFGVYDGQKQIGFGRVISDFATYAYLCDDYIQEEYRGKGLGSWLMECILRHPDLQGLRRWMLIAQEPRLYAKFGFKPLVAPQMNMELLNADIYKKAAPHVA
jgi:GNAT superfamily N-acetyltransferase